MKLLKIFNEENVSQEKVDTFLKYKSVHAVLFDSENKIALFHTNKFKYHGIPGGGIEEGETVEQAIIRECKEETGCNVQIVKEIGMTISVMDKKEQVNEAYCFILRVVGEIGEPSLTQEEVEEELVLEWVNLEKAMEDVQNDIVGDNLYHDYIKMRTLVFLEKAKNLLI